MPSTPFSPLLLYQLRELSQGELSRYLVPAQSMETRKEPLPREHKMSTVILQAQQAVVRTSGDVSGSVLVPDFSGKRLFTGQAIYNDQLQPIFPKPIPMSFAKPYLPCSGSNYFMRLDYSQWDELGGTLSFFDQGQEQPFAQMGNIEGVTNEQIAYGELRDTLTHDQRILFIPKAKLIVTIPKSDDRLILYRFDIDAARKKKGGI